MANTQTINKIKEYLQEKKTAVAPSDICFNARIKWKSVQDCLKFLVETNQVVMITSDSGHSLVQIKNECDNYAKPNN